MAKTKFPTPKTPRTVEQLNQLYSQMVSKLGENRVHAERLEAQNKNILTEIGALEIEAQEATALAKKVADAAATTEGAKS